MAENSDNESERDRSFDRQPNDFLYNQIKRLEKEKADIERKNREKELLEQKLKELKGTVSALKGNSPGLTSPTSNSGSSSARKARKDDSSINISEFGKVKNKLNTSVLSEHEETDSNNESDKSSEEEEEEEKAEEVMSTHHKQKIQKNRDTLVENMIPDDIFNDLIAGKILTTADVSRIKKKSTREAINEELLNNIVLKSDRAFYVFIKALRKTLQEYLVNLLEPPLKGKKKKRKRQQREMNISVDVNQVTPITKSIPTCTCQEVEEQILIMSKNAYRNIRRRDDSASAFEQFRKELAQTNTVIKDSMEIMNTLKILCRHGEITGVSRGSVKFTLQFSSVQMLKTLWTLFQSGDLISALQSSLITSNFMKYFNLKDIKLGVRISEEEYETCVKELNYSTNCSSRSPLEKLAMQAADCSSLDIENSPSPKTMHIHHNGPRRAFNEIQKNRGLLNEDPSNNKCEKCLQASPSPHLRSHQYN